jgi:hypothetical protein
MTELNWTLSWTLVTIGVCWLFVSCAVALALGRIIQRSKAGASISPESMDGHSEAYIADEDGELDLDDEGSRAASGTRLRAVWFEDEALETKPDERKVS